MRSHPSEVDGVLVIVSSARLTENGFVRVLLVDRLIQLDASSGGRETSGYAANAPESRKTLFSYVVLTGQLAILRTDLLSLSILVTGLAAPCCWRANSASKKLYSLLVQPPTPRM